jgi:hypothetical protein
MKCSRCQQENPSHAKFGLECAAPVNGVTPGSRSSAEMKDDIEGLRRSLSEALEQQVATAEILRVISWPWRGIHRAARRPHLGQESGGFGLDVHVYDSGAPWRMS